MQQILCITQPDDWHIHLRDTPFLETTVKDAARQFNRVIVMPNLESPVINVALATNYYQTIKQYTQKTPNFNR